MFYGIDIVHAVEFSKIGGFYKSVFRLTRGATFLTYLENRMMSNQHSVESEIFFRSFRKDNHKHIWRQLTRATGLEF